MVLCALCLPEEGPSFSVQCLHPVLLVLGLHHASGHYVHTMSSAPPYSHCWPFSPMASTPLPMQACFT